MRIIGKVSKDECREIEIINEKIFALKNLMKIIDSKANEALYSHCIDDYNFHMKEFSDWWCETQKKYNWKVSEEEFVNIKFQTGEIFVNEEAI